MGEVFLGRGRVENGQNGEKDRPRRGWHQQRLPP